MISTFATGVSYVAFLFGFSSYSFIDNKESLVFEREASIEEAQNQENDIVKQEERGKEPCQASGSLSLRLDKILAGGRGKFWALIKKLNKEKKLLVQEMLAAWLAYLGCSVVMGAGSTSISNSLSRTIPKKWKSSSATTRVEIQRMKNLWRVGVGDHTVKPVSMTIFWLLPQFFLLGLMEGLVGGGLTDLIVHGVNDADDKDDKSEEEYDHFARHYPQTTTTCSKSRVIA
ncbi:protein NRT1/ PTR FAMILY 5.10-like [Prunus yedoensis var. nudiflora]|uniref:Protein NRT1/ PTR FAMILY 5.10-like n=1 Tax=Prunus yedoensis var. nudiflora TaxID=2094558 RepID=A0A314UDP9_PRUYE|nr:protein NRT1/ PTR FAMILY 5.10-like [Prunus yedoensis var. nudiflora]